MDTSSNDVTNKEILQHLKSIEARISKIEAHIDLQPSESEESIEEETIIPKRKPETDEELEFRIGQYWFAKLGIFVFLVGWLIANTLHFDDINQIIPVAVGFITGLVVIATAFFIKNKFPHISGWVLGSGFAIIYLAIIRMHFFSLSPLVTNIIPILVILYLVSVIIIVTGIKWRSSYLTSLGISAALLTGMICDYSYLIFVTIALVSILSSNLKLKLNWDGLINFTIIAAFFVHLLWFINNPLLGNALEIQTDVPLNLLFILIYQIIFSLAFLNDKKTEENLLPSLSVLAITSIGYGLFLLITILSSPPLGQVYHLLASAIYLVFAVLFFKIKQSRVSTFFYAMTGYGALSIAIILQFDKPDFFMWLCWQSFLVVSTAVWFRSKFIIVANFIIFLLIFIVFLFVSAATSWISLSFGIVALFSARILNWKKDVLELKTEHMRNAYLLTAFFIIPYSLYNMLPSGYVAFSWIIVAILYYVFSLILKNTKYRYMSLATFMLTVLYVFVLGITSEETIFKILSFLVLGAALVIISVVYTRNRNKATKVKESEG
jgi:Predicted membrane protein (DUF2339)